MKNILFQVKTDFSLESAMREAKDIGLQNTFVIEDVVSNDLWIGGLIEKVPDENSLITLHLRGPNEVNWKSQWETFSENFQNGVAHINLSCFGYNKLLYLLPGEGFGDLSHATTYLMMDLMKDKVSEKQVIDIGSGSGILTLGAKLMGAKSAHGIEIDPAALRHAEKNTLKNSLEVKFSTHLDMSKLKKGSIFLMNMTFLEQVKFLEENHEISNFAETFVTSGILKTQKDQYIDKTLQWGWDLIEMKNKDKWLGFVFSMKNF